jgi:hypothetical protein
MLQNEKMSVYTMIGLPEVKLIYNRGWNSLGFTPFVEHDLWSWPWMFLGSSKAHMFGLGMKAGGPRVQENSVRNCRNGLWLQFQVAFFSRVLYIYHKPGEWS